MKAIEGTLAKDKSTKIEDDKTQSDGVFSQEALTAPTGDVRPSDVFAFAWSKEVVLHFKYPVYIDRMHFRANQQFVKFYRSEHQGADPDLFFETWGEEGLVYARREFSADQEGWVPVVMPPRGMAKVKRIVISQGLELDNLRLYMEFPVVVQYVRLQDTDLERFTSLLSEGLKEVHSMEKQPDSTNTSS